MRITRGIATALLTVFAAGFTAEACTRPGTQPVSQMTGALVKIENHNFSDMDVFVLRRGGVPERLGVSIGASENTFALTRQMIASGPVRIIAVPIGGRGAASSGSLTVSGGDTVLFTIEPDLHLSVATIRS